MSDTPENPTIFLSFANDDRPMASELHARLQTIVGTEVVCFLSSVSIEPGSHYPSAIDGRLRAAECVVVLLSDNAMRSCWVSYEAGVGYGRGAEVIPIALAGFQVDRQKPPLLFHQAVTIGTLDQLNGVLHRIEKRLERKFTRQFSSEDHAAIAGKATRPDPQMEIKPLYSRDKVFDVAVEIVGSAPRGAVIRGFSSLVHNKDKPDHDMRRLNDAVRARFQEAKADKCGMRYEVILGIHRYRGSIPPDAKAAIARRAEQFELIDAAKSLRIYESPDAWSMNLLMVNDNDALLAFPQGVRGSRLRYGMRVKGAALVAPIVRWFEKGLKTGTRRLYRRDWR
ncbi:MAG: toll/interleukin-1 receptor domain-containing protein [Acidobacteriota bacterium]